MAVQNGLELAELRHRLLNNFQLLQALIGIRLRSVEDPESRRHLTWLTDVIAALALLNRRLGSGTSDFGAYLREAAGFWERIAAGREIAFQLDAAAVTVPERMSSSLALIVHELVANAVEHAFPDNKPGGIAITLRDAYGVLELTVRDDGQGGARLKDETEGLALVRGLADYLGGTLQLENDAGLIATVRVPLDAPKAARKH
ncbi:MAG TPA: sensor histidine kinase [Caulobacteraceae bacterium]|nr:sensor histidine kinase [Caulobacteraceae bacterium]